MDQSQNTLRDKMVMIYDEYFEKLSTKIGFLKFSTLEGKNHFINKLSKSIDELIKQGKNVNNISFFDDTSLSSEGKMRNFLEEENIEIDEGRSVREQYNDYVIHQYIEFGEKLINRSNKEIASSLESYEEIVETNSNLNSLLSMFGSGFDLSKMKPTKKNIEFILKLSKYFEKSKFIEKIMKMLGRGLDDGENASKGEMEKSKFKNFSNYEDAVGVKFGNDIPNAMPFSLSLHSNSKTKNLFKLNFTEKKLMEIQHETYSLKPKDTKGPIVVLIDTSGSMSGEPELYAKAIALKVATQAIREKRPCYLIMFSIEAIFIDLSKIYEDAESLYEFFSTSLYGGSDVDASLAHAYKLFKEQKGEKSDILIVSDFYVMISDKLLSETLEMKQLQNKLIGIAINEFFYSFSYKSLYDTFELVRLLDDFGQFEIKTRSFTSINDRPKTKGKIIYY